MYALTEVRVGDVQVDDYSQRTYRSSHSDKIATCWDDEFVGVLVLNRRENGVLYCIDGQHRARAAQQVKGDQYVLPALVHEGLSRVREAQMFIAFNRDRWATPKIEEYRISLAAEDPDYVAVDGVLTSCNLAMGTKAGQKTIGAVAAVMRMSNRYGPDLLRTTLVTCAEAWGYYPETWDSDIMQAVNLVFGLNKNVDHERLLKVLRQHNPVSWQNTMSLRAPGGGGSSSRSNLVNAAIIGVYNKGLRSDSSKLVSSRKG